MRNSFGLPIALLLLIPITAAHQFYPVPHVPRGFPVWDTHHSPDISASVYRRAVKPASSSTSIQRTTVRYHHAENYALRELARARAIARSLQAHVRAAEIRTYAASAYEYGRAAEEFRADINRRNPAKADYGHLHALDWIEVNILAPAYALWQRFCNP